MFTSMFIQVPMKQMAWSRGYCSVNYLMQDLGPRSSGIAVRALTDCPSSPMFSFKTECISMLSRAYYRLGEAELKSRLLQDTLISSTASANLILHL